MTSVLSIQSAVTLGAVGNTMASAVMDAFGHELCRIDTVQLTAHPGHGFWAGGSIDDGAFQNLINGISSLNRWGDFDAVMTGYMGSTHQINAIAQALTNFHESRSGHPILVDTAVGDHGKLYVAEELAMAMASDLMPLADIITPNAFELSYFSGQNITSVDDAYNAAQMLMTRYSNLSVVVATGIADKNQVFDAVLTKTDQHIFGGNDGEAKEGMPKKGMPGGGDLFASLMMAAKLKGADWVKAGEQASRICRQILADAGHTNAKDIDISIVKQILRGAI